MRNQYLRSLKAENNVSKIDKRFVFYKLLAREKNNQSIPFSRVRHIACSVIKVWPSDLDDFIDEMESLHFIKVSKNRRVRVIL